MRLVVGLGNPGKEYQNTRHNIGFILIDEYARENNLTFKVNAKFNAEIIKEKDFILLKPLTYMNNSGISVGSVCRFYNIKPEDVLVISDDLDLPMGKIRLRTKGSSGGHNGLKSIIAHLNSQDFNRFRFGIGDSSKNVIDYVLGAFSKQDKDIILEKEITSNKIINDFVKGEDFLKIMNKYN